MYFKKSCAAVFVSVSLFTSIVIAGVEAPFEIGTWGNFAKGAISHTFDDNTTNQTGSGQAAFDQYGFHMTLFTVTQSMNPNWEKLKAAFAKGHEIASHSVTHPNGTMPASELSPSQKTIQEKVPGVKCITIAYPNCNTPGDGEVVKYYIAGRNCDGKINPKTPTNWAQVGSKLIGSCGGCPNDANTLNSYADQAASQNGWATTCNHGIGSESHGYAVTNLDAMKSHLGYLDKNRDKIWCETFGNVSRYIKERDAASLAVKSTSDSKITISLTDNLADSIFNYPLTIRRPLPDGWEKAAVTQNSKPVEDSIITVSSKKYIMFKAVPDGGDIVITSDGVEVNRPISTISPVSSVVLNKNSITINSDGFSGSAISVVLFNLRGEIVARYSIKNNATSFSLPLNKLINSAFVIKVTDGKTTVVNRCLSQM